MAKFRWPRRYIPKKRPINYHPDYAEYERLKLEWTMAHPESEPEEYQMAMREIAARCGI